MILHWQQILQYYAGSIDRAELNRAHSGLVGRAGQTSYALLLCRAASGGEQRFASGHGMHAEAHLLASPLWREQIPDALARRSALDSQPLVVTLVINRSPCGECAASLAAALGRLGMQFAARIENTRFICASRGYYQGNFLGSGGLRRDRVTTHTGLEAMRNAGWELAVLQMDNQLPARGNELLDYLSPNPGRLLPILRLES